MEGYLQRRDKLKNPEEHERLLREIPVVITKNLESETTTPDVPVKKLETSFQEFSETTCAKASLVTEVPKAVADDFSDEEEWLFHGIPHVTPGYLDSSESKTLEVPEQKAENDMQGFREATCTKESLVTEVSKPVAIGFACRATKLYLADQTKPENESPKSILNLSRPSEVPLFNMEINSTALNCISRDTSAVNQWSSVSVHQQPAKPTNFAYNGVSMPAKSNKVRIGDKISQAPTDNQVRPAKIIELSDNDDDDEKEKPSTIQPVHCNRHRFCSNSRLRANQPKPRENQTNTPIFTAVKKHKLISQGSKDSKIPKLALGQNSKRKLSSEYRFGFSNKQDNPISEHQKDVYRDTLLEPKGPIRNSKL